MTKTHQSIKQDILQWLEHAVIGLNLCPFASYPYQNNQVRIEISDVTSDKEALLALQHELTFINDSEPSKVETTLLVFPCHMIDFFDFNQFLNQVDHLLEVEKWAGEYQVATFHPHYQFAQTQPDDAENLTNRSPYPILHIIRETSLEKVLETYPDPDDIYLRNIKTVSELTKEQRKNVFHYLFKSKE